jgi:hypothetical protein
VEVPLSLLAAALLPLLPLALLPLALSLLAAALLPLALLPVAVALLLGTRCGGNGARPAALAAARSAVISAVEMLLKGKKNFPPGENSFTNCTRER